MSRVILLAAVAALIFCSSASAQQDHCAQYMTCQQCISHNLCGWCSEDVTYPDGERGAQCAGFNANGSNPFVCNGIYSTEECEAGWLCSQENFTCYQGAPGQGNTKGQCEANCTNQGQVYLCNHTTKQCYPVADGTPGSASLPVCEASCIHPSHHPSSPSPVTPAKTYVCNTTSGQCEVAQPGHGASKQVCQQGCQNSSSVKYMCNSFTHKCEQLPPGSPGGETKAECDSSCSPQPKPGPPPQFMGLWRGVEIQNGYKIGEWDMHFTQTSATIVNVRGAVTIKGTPYNVVNGDALDLWVNITSGPGVGQVIKAIGVTASRGPETSFLTAAFSAPGGKTPASVNAAMTSGTDTVYFLAECAGTSECVFTMPATQQRVKEILAKIELLSQEAIQKELGAAKAEETTDPCSAYGANCSFCISHQFCGWCSEDVTYKNGVKGTQCAGFSSNPNASNPFICRGRYSTTNCNQGFNCNTENYTCVPNPIPGNGQPQNVCEAECRPTPAPTHVEEYLCNLTTKQCHKCPERFCPGAMPETQCAAACVKPHHGPSTIVAGVWRGIEIQQHYPLAEFEMVFNASEVAMYKNGEMQWSGTIESYGGDVMIFDVTTGAAQGKVPAIYTVADQSAMYSVMTIAFGTNNGAIPQGYSGPMQTNGMYEMTLAKCLSSPCKFNMP